MPFVGTTSDVFFFVQQLLELGIGFLQQRCGLGLEVVELAGAGRADDTARCGGGAGRLANGR